MGLEYLARSHFIQIARPGGKPHPCFPDVIPPDFGYLENKSAGNGSGLDVWIGSTDARTLTGILCIFDKIKRDAAIKLLIGCTLEGIEMIRNFHHPLLRSFIPNPVVKQ